MPSVVVLLLSDKLGLSMMALPKKFAVVELKEVCKSGQNPYKCVPKTWLKFKNSDEVMLPYPTAEELSLSMDLIMKHAPPLLSWPSHEATFVCELDTYEEFLFLLTLKDENVKTWKKLSCELRERWSRQHSRSMLYQL